MGTRSCIARLTGPGKFTGVYHHWDGYPNGLGVRLHELYHTHFKKDISAMLKYLIDEHPAGWSTIMGLSSNPADFSLSPGYIDDMPEKEPYGPVCFCHGGRSEEGWVVTEQNASGSGCEYAYAFTKGENGHNLMVVLSSYRKSGTKMIGMFGFGDENAEWREIGVVDLDSETGPEWSKFDEA